MRLQACLNGARPAGTPHVPVTPAELAADARACRAAGASMLHFHPRDATGAETTAGDHVAAALIAVRAAVPGMPVGISTGDWIAPRSRRMADMSAWTELPDFVSLNLSEPDAPEVMALMQRLGVGLELSVSTVEDMARLRTLPGAGVGAVRAMIGIDRATLPLARAAAAEIVPQMRAALPGLPVLLHAFGPAAWDFVALARQWGCDETRIGLEDTLTCPDGRACGNAGMVAAAMTLIAPCPAFPRRRDDLGHAWGLDGPEPAHIWERFSPAYEAQAERLAHALADRGLDVSFDGAGSEDGEFISTRDGQGRFALIAHLEDPAEARALAAMDDAALTGFLTERLEMRG